MITLYSFWRSLAATRVRIALNIKGIAHTEVSIDLIKGEQFADSYKKVNPQSVVPSLDLGDGTPVLFQSLAILEYLDETHPQPPLLPSLASPGGARARARVRGLALIHAADTHPLVVPRIRKMLEQEYKLDEATRNVWLRGWIDAGSRALEAHLSSGQGTGRYCHGDTLTMADVCVASHWIGAEMFGADRTSFPTMARVMNECFELDAFTRAHPKRQPGAPA